MMALRSAGLTLSLVILAGSAHANPSSPWGEDPFWDRPAQRSSRVESLPDYRRPPPLMQSGEAVRDGGPRPAIAPRAPPIVAWRYDAYLPGSIVIDTSGRRLYFVLPGNRAFQYPISVGREGFVWAGTETISRKQAWPDWHPPEEMRKRDPKLPVKMTGGLKNPLGAMALYLGNTLYRIHGTNDEKTIGYASSSGCFRMMNSSVLHLAQFAQVGTSVSVVNALPNAPTPPVAARRPEAPPPVLRRPLDPPIARRPIEPASPPLARRPYDPEPPVDARRAEREPERDWPPRDAADLERDDPYMARGSDRSRLRPPPSMRDDYADVRVQEDLDDYDPYVARRPYTPRRFSAPRYRDDYYDGRRDSFASQRPGGRIWYDDERDDY
jgi:lipoprotein-anchoring transpeptidase ErfK/SrfK